MTRLNTLLLAGALLTLFPQPCVYAQTSPNWRYVEELDPVTDQKKRFIYGRPFAGGSTNESQYIRIGCYERDMGVTLSWGTPITPRRRDGSDTTEFASVTVRFDTSEPRQMIWAASESYEFTYAPVSLAAVGVQLENSLFAAILGTQAASSTWTAKELHYSLLSAKRTIFRAYARRGPEITLVFDMTGYYEEALKFADHCNPNGMRGQQRSSGNSSQSAGRAAPHDPFSDITKDVSSSAASTASGASTAPRAQSVDLFRKNWVAVPGIRKLFVNRSPELGKHVITDNSSVEFTNITWLDGTIIVRVQDPSWSNKNLFMYYLVRGSEIVHLYGTSPPLHAFLKGKQIKLDDQSAKDYLWFFTFFVRGADGPFLIVENQSDTYFPRFPADESSKRKWEPVMKALKPVQCENQGSTSKCTATIYYANAIFSANFNILQTGMVEMKDDTPLFAELPARVNAPIN